MASDYRVRAPEPAKTAEPKRGMFDGLKLTVSRKALEEAPPPVAGVDHLPILRASHIKPWKDASNTERLDPFNGLLLSAHVDALFDRGLISFEDDGKLLISRALSRANVSRLAIAPNSKIVGLKPQHAPYLAHHRTRCFIS
jgi:hypothetical protein